MALRDFQQIVKDADALTPEDQIRLANYLYSKAVKQGLKPTENLSEFSGSIHLTIDPTAYQAEIRAEWS